MSQIRRIALFGLLAAVLLAGPGLAQTVLAGATPGGAFYTIVAPPGWTPADGLVIWNHGFSLDPIAPGPDLGPLQDLQLVEGYAVAASSYSQRGWALFQTENDLEELYQVFVANLGEPSHVLLFGASLGGIVTAQAIEQADLGNVVGALPICGAMAGSRNWDAALDLRLIYDAVCAGVAGAAIPGGAAGLALGSALTPTDTVLAINACFGQDLPAAARSEAQQKRLDLFLKVTGIPQSFISTTLGFFATFGQADLVYDPAKLGGLIGTGNRNVDYGDPTINATIERVGARGSQRKLLRDNYTPNGDVGKVKIVSIHTDKDGLVLVENESFYAQRVPPGNLTVGIVQEAVPTHCGFTTSELIASWEVLRGWVAGDPKPSALSLQVMCLALAPTFGGPCRYNPFFQLPDVDGRLRPRNPGKGTTAARTAAKAGATAPATAPADGPRVAPGAAGDAAAAQPAAQAAETQRPARAAAPAEIEPIAPPAPRGRELDRRER